MLPCLCIKKIEGYEFQINHKYFFTSMNMEYFPQNYDSVFLVFAFGKVIYLNVSNFNEYFIDIQQHRQNLINQLLC